jgi:hypothetical protein
MLRKDGRYPMKRFEKNTKSGSDHLLLKELKLPIFKQNTARLIFSIVRLNLTQSTPGILAFKAYNLRS